MRRNDLVSYDPVIGASIDRFERICQRLLRESGFQQVRITGRSGDGGIDGKGVLRLGGLINFQVVFQSKRYVGTVSASTIRDFTFAADTARGFVLAATCNKAVGQTINIGNGTKITIGELAEVISAITGGGGERRESARMRPTGSEVRELHCDRQLAQKLFDWKPTVTLKDGLLDTVNFIRTHPDRYRPAQYVV